MLNRYEELLSKKKYKKKQKSSHLFSLHTLQALKAFFEPTGGWKTACLGVQHNKHDWKRSKRGTELRTLCCTSKEALSFTGKTGHIWTQKSSHETLSLLKLSLRGNAVKRYTKAMQGIVGASLSKMFPESRSTFGKRIELN